MGFGCNKLPRCPVSLKDRVTPAGIPCVLHALGLLADGKAWMAGLRLDRNQPCLLAWRVRTTQGQQVEYTLLDLPHFIGSFTD